MRIRICLTTIFICPIDFSLQRRIELERQVADLQRQLEQKDIDTERMMEEKEVSFREMQQTYEEEIVRLNELLEGVEAELSM
jgi:hypothetical protein